MSTSTQPKLRFIIVGAGLVGLTTARVLREHHQVTVYERGNEDIATGGQGITIYPNAVKLLNPLGYDRERAGAVPQLGHRAYNRSGEVKMDYELHLKDRFGEDGLMQKRSQFREELFRLATTPSSELGIEGETPKMVFNNGVVDLDPEKGVVTLSDGSTDEADVVIVADGIHSHLRHLILGSHDYEAQKKGFVVYRVAIDADTTRQALGYLPHWFEPSKAQGRMCMMEADDDTGRFIGIHPISNYKYINLICGFPSTLSKRANTSTNSWYADADREEMEEVFSDYPEEMRKIISVATEVKYWELQDIEPVPTFTRGRAIMIGDAAHAMTPMQGQGVNMGVEDAEAFCLFSRPGVGPEDIPQILQAIDAVRRPRTKQVLLDTREVHATKTLMDRAKGFLKHVEYNMSYKGIHNALKEQGLSIP